MSTPSPSADRDLMFGLIALRSGLIAPGALREGIQAWAGQPARSLGQVLQDRGELTPDARRTVEAEVEGRLGRGSGDSLSGTSTTLLDWRVTTPPAGPPGGDPLPVPNGPRYRKLRPHRRGGVGEVHVALDAELNREVALKEIQPRHADRPDFRARFLREALITGGLEHPGIVPVHGLGAHDDGRPFYVMRFVHGVSLHEAIRAFHTAEGSPGRPPGERELALRSLLTRFVAVCNAVAYAHSRGVIHRDLKPSNVMLGDYGETLVVDWGLAKRQDEADDAPAPSLSPSEGIGSTEAGRAVGTPGFMPPEQARGQWGRVGPRSDVFALGATLYALLTGKAPYEGPEALERAAAAQPVPARQVNGRAPAALEAVCARAMAARPEDRYASATDLAADVERWLADEPVSAHTEPLPARARRWARRHQALVSAGVVLLLASVAGLGIGLAAVRAEQGRTESALVQARDAGEEARQSWGRAVRAEQGARKSLGIAEDNFKLAKKAVDECFGIAKSNPLLQAPNLRQVRNLLLEQSLGLYQNFRQQRPDDPRLGDEVADHHLRIGYIQEELGNLREADRHYLAAIATLRQALTRQRDDPRLVRQLCWALVWCSYNSQHLRSLGPALRQAAEAVEVGRRAVRIDPNDTESPHALANALSTYGKVQNYRGRHREAMQHYAEAVALLRPIVRARPEVLKYQANLALLLHQLSEAETNTHRNIEQSIELAREGVEWDRRVIRTRPDAPVLRLNYTYRLLSLCGHLHRQGREEEALRVSTEAINVLRHLVRTQPEVPVYQSRLAKALDRRASVQLARGKVAAALADVTACFSLLEELAARDFEPMELRIQQYEAHVLRAQIQLALNRPDDSLADCARAAAVSPHGMSSVLLVVRAAALARKGEHDLIAAEAEELMRGHLDALGHFHLARMWALSAAGVYPGALAPLPLHEKREGRIREAMTSLERAKRADYFDAPIGVRRLDRSPDLAVLRDRPEYQRFRATLGAAGGM